MSLAFQTKQLEPAKRVCIRLKEYREAGHISLSDLSEQTKISKKYLTAMEECRFDDIPFAHIYKKNFIKRYAEALRMDDVDELVNQFTEEEEPVIEAPPEPTAMKQSRFQNFPSLWKYLIGFTMIALLASYLGLQIKRIVDPPSLTLISPLNGFITTDKFLTVQGSASTHAKVSINGQTIPNDGQGQFREVLPLSPGINTITISAQKKHGKATEQTFHVIAKEAQQFTLK